MDFIGDEDATRHALDVAFREHERKTREGYVPLNSLPAADIARVFIDELSTRGWKLEKKDPRER